MASPCEKRRRQRIQWKRMATRGKPPLLLAYEERCKQDAYAEEFRKAYYCPPSQFVLSADMLKAEESALQQFEKRVKARRERIIGPIVSPSMPEFDRRSYSSAKSDAVDVLRYCISVLEHAEPVATLPLEG